MTIVDILEHNEAAGTHSECETSRSSHTFLAKGRSLQILFEITAAFAVLRKKSIRT